MQPTNNKIVWSRKEYPEILLGIASLTAGEKNAVNAIYKGKMMTILRRRRKILGTFKGKYQLTKMLIGPKK